MKKLLLALSFILAGAVAHAAGEESILNPRLKGVGRVSTGSLTIESTSTLILKGPLLLDDREGTGASITMSESHAILDGSTTFSGGSVNVASSATLNLYGSAGVNNGSGISFFNGSAIAAAAGFIGTWTGSMTFYDVTTGDGTPLSLIIEGTATLSAGTTSVAAPGVLPTFRIYGNRGPINGSTTLAPTLIFTPTTGSFTITASTLTGSVVTSDVGTVFWRASK